MSSRQITRGETRLRIVAETYATASRAGHRPPLRNENPGYFQVSLRRKRQRVGPVCRAASTRYIRLDARSLCSESSAPKAAAWEAESTARRLRARRVYLGD